MPNDNDPAAVVEMIKNEYHDYIPTLTTHITVRT